MLFALLLVNAFVAKELHYIIEFSHGHDHHLVDRHLDCSNTDHFHEYHFEGECHICAFNFSPRDHVDSLTLLINIPAFHNAFFISENETYLNNSNSPPNLRGPPVHFV